MGHHIQDCPQVIDRIGDELEAHADVPGTMGEDQHGEVAVTHDEEAQPAAVDVAALRGQGEQGGVDEELLVEVASLLEALCRAGLDRIWTCCPFSEATYRMSGEIAKTSSCRSPITFLP